MSYQRFFSTRLFCLVTILIFLLAACNPATQTPALTIVSGSENQTLEPMIQEWAKSQGFGIQMTYLGSLDIARLLQSGTVTYDAVWPANRLWIDYGDVNNIVRHDESIMRSPVVFAVKRSIAERLGWIGKDVFMNDILTATENGSIRFMMTSATQSNSGASFYFGALSAFAGNPDVLTSPDLKKPEVEENITRILGTINRSSGSSGWLKDLFLQQYDRFDAMVNYESVMIEANTALVNSGREPLYAIYPIDGLTIADSPLAYIDHGDKQKEERFLALQQHLLSEPIQRQLLQSGRRATLLGIQLQNADTTVFKSEWGLDVTRVLQPIRLPSREVIEEALNLYQIAFRKPSCTAYVLDFSGSMVDNGEDDLKAAMRTLLDQDLANQYLLQGHPDDVSVVIVFNDGVINANELDRWTVEGNDPAQLRQLYSQIEALNANGGTNIFDSARVGLEYLAQSRSTGCLPAVILMTDGQDTVGHQSALEQYIRSSENDIPVFAITFGAADETQLTPFTSMTFGRIFDGRADLISAFRAAKGYN